MLIGFIGAPSCGKSTTAFGLCYRLKQEGHAVEFFPEYARYHIMQCRLQGLQGSGGLEGQEAIYTHETNYARFYRQNADAVSITDGSTLNCFFYGYDQLDLLEEARKYDLLFYIHAKEVPYTETDTNRVEDNAQIIQMAQQWKRTIRPLIQHTDNIIEIEGYPALTQQQMLDVAYGYIKAFLLTKQAA